MSFEQYPVVAFTSPLRKGPGQICQLPCRAKGLLGMSPARRFAILTCMDARLDPAKFAGLAEGDAHVIRNAGWHDHGRGPSSDAGEFSDWLTIRDAPASVVTDVRRIRWQNRFWMRRYGRYRSCSSRWIPLGRAAVGPACLTGKSSRASFLCSAAASLGNCFLKNRAAVGHDCWRGVQGWQAKGVWQRIDCDNWLGQLGEIGSATATIP